MYIFFHGLDLFVLKISAILNLILIDRIVIILVGIFKNFCIIITNFKQESMMKEILGKFNKEVSARKEKIRNRKKETYYTFFAVLRTVQNLKM